jgi:hypothetical protein
MPRTDQDLTDDVKKYVSINETLQVRLMDDPNFPTGYSRINDITEGKLVIAWPTHRGKRMLLHRSDAACFHHAGVPHEYGGWWMNWIHPQAAADHVIPAVRSSVCSDGRISA